MPRTNPQTHARTARARPRSRGALADTADLAELADRRTEFAAVTAAIAELPTRQREAVALRDFLGLSYEEVAATLSVSVPVVESLPFPSTSPAAGHRSHGSALRGKHRRVPFALRAAVAREIPDFDGGGGGLGVAGAAVAAASAGVAKLISLPFAAKAVTAVTVVAAATVAPRTPGHDREGARLRKGAGGDQQPAGNGSAEAPSATASGATTAEGQERPQTRAHRPPPQPPPKASRRAPSSKPRSRRSGIEPAPEATEEALGTRRTRSQRRGRRRGQPRCRRAASGRLGRFCPLRVLVARRTAYRARSRHLRHPRLPARRRPLPARRRPLPARRRPLPARRRPLPISLRPVPRSPPTV